jgi:predicted nucleotidyltransferase
MVSPAREVSVDEVIQAMAVAVGRSLSARCIILFGSRARGDYKDYSDVDLAVILDQPPVPLGSQERIRLEGQGAATAESVCGKLFRRIDVRLWTEPEYRKQKRSINHVAGRSWREGKVLYGSHETLPGEEEVAELDHVRELVDMARGNIDAMSALDNASIREEHFGFHAERATELTLKAWLALNGRQYSLTHRLEVLLNELEQSGAVGTSRFRHLASLTNYAVIYQYQGIPVPTMDRRWMTGQVSRLVEHVSALLDQAEAS